jgi:hypothetical protein
MQKLRRQTLGNHLRYLGEGTRAAYGGWVVHGCVIGCNTNSLCRVINTPHCSPRSPLLNKMDKPPQNCASVETRFFTQRMHARTRTRTRTHSARRSTQTTGSATGASTKTASAMVHVGGAGPSNGHISSAAAGRGPAPCTGSLCL